MHLLVAGEAESIVLAFNCLESLDIENGDRTLLVSDHAQLLERIRGHADRIPSHAQQGHEALVSHRKRCLGQIRLGHISNQPARRCSTLCMRLTAPMTAIHDERVVGRRAS